MKKTAFKTIALLGLFVFLSSTAQAWSGNTPFTVGLASSTQPILTITNTGVVGIGMPAPISTLSIQHPSVAFTMKNSTTNQVWQIRNGAEKFSTAFDLYNYTKKKVAFMVNTDGNVSIGTNTTPLNSRLYVYGGPTGANIDVRGDSTIVGGDQATIELEGDDYDTIPNSALLQYFGSKAMGSTMGYPNKRLGVLGFVNADTAIIQTVGKPTPLLFGTDGVERMRLDAKGRLGIGTKSPASPLHVSAGASGTTTVTIGELNATGSTGCVNMNRADGGPGSFYISAEGAMVVESNYCK